MGLEAMQSQLAQNAGTTLDSPEGKHGSENSLLSIDGTPVKGNALAGGTGLEGSSQGTLLDYDNPPTAMTGLAAGSGHGSIGGGASNLDIDGTPERTNGLAK